MRAVVVAVAVLVAGCAPLTKARQISDVAVAAKALANHELIVEADIERRRLRSARCHSPALNPDAIVRAASDPALGARWTDELLRDCPDFEGWVIATVLRRVRERLPELFERPPAEGSAP